MEVGDLLSVSLPHSSSTLFSVDMIGCLGMEPLKREAAAWGTLVGWKPPAEVTPKRRMSVAATTVSSPSASSSLLTLPANDPNARDSELPWESPWLDGPDFDWCYVEKGRVRCRYCEYVGVKSVLSRGKPVSDA